jgi:hypothetical protein
MNSFERVALGMFAAGVLVVAIFIGGVIVSGSSDSAKSRFFIGQALNRMEREPDKTSLMELAAACAGPHVLCVVPNDRRGVVIKYYRGNNPATYREIATQEVRVETRPVLVADEIKFK